MKPVSNETTGLLLAQGNNDDAEGPSNRVALELVSEPDEHDDFLEGLDVSALLVPRRQQVRSGKPRSPLIRSVLVAILVCGFAVRLLGFSSSSSSSNSNSQSNASSTTIGSLPSTYWDDETHHKWQEYLMNSNSRDPSLSMMASASLMGSAAATESSSRSSRSVVTTTSSGLLYFNQTSAFAMLDPQADFYHYQNGWEAQITQALCAIATTAALLNSMRDVGPRFVLPQDPIYRPFLWATQADLLGEAVDNDCVIEALGGTLFNVASVYHMGLGLAMVPKLANCFLQSNGFEAQGHPALVSEKDAIKELVLEALADPSKRVVYNYDRGGIGQGPMGHGHWSPLGGYNAQEDSFLVMDVAKYKHPMVWVHWDDLWNGAATLDPCGQTLALGFVDWSHRDVSLYDYLKTRCIPGSRGFVVVRAIGEGEL